MTQAGQSLMVSSRLWEVQDPLSWVSCFLAFVGAKVDSKETRELAAYGQIIIHLARKHGGKGWLSYDRLFRQQVAAGSPIPWAELNPSLMAATVLGSMGPGEPGRVCNLCLASDHISTECALSSLEPVKPQQLVRHSGSSRVTYTWDFSRPRPYPSPRVQSATSAEDNICRRFNRGVCTIYPCKFDHLCNVCFRNGHCALDCRMEREQASPIMPVNASNAK